MNTLIVDSGSTKSHWYFLDEKYNTQKILNLPGINPFFQTEEVIFNIISKGLPTDIDCKLIRELFFYGSGCSNTFRVQRVMRVLLKFFPDAKITIEHDLLGAARAACLHQAGVACILGTGSNSCLYDGKNIVQNVMNIGPYLGDEGSGMHLGKLLLRAYFYDELPPELKNSFIENYGDDKKRLKNELYDSPTPGAYIASFAPFLKQHLDHPFIQQVGIEAFSSFLQHHVLKYPDSEALPIHFIGSIAEKFSDLLVTALDNHGLKIGNIIKDPIKRLVVFHSGMTFGF